MFRGWYVVLQKMGSDPAVADKIEGYSKRIKSM